MGGVILGLILLILGAWVHFRLFAPFILGYMEGQNKLKIFFVQCISFLITLIITFIIVNELISTDMLVL